MGRVTKKPSRKTGTHKRDRRTARERLRLEAGKVESPYTGVNSPDRERFDKVQRIVDTLTAMCRRGHISKRQWEMAGKFRDAYQAISGAEIRSILDDSRQAFGSGMAPSVSANLLWAAELLRRAKRLLGVMDFRVVCLICGEGYSVVEATRAIMRKGKVSGKDSDSIGRRLKDSLNTLADELLPHERRRGILGERGEDAKPGVMGPAVTVVQRGGAVHASMDGIEGINPKHRKLDRFPKIDKPRVGNGN